MTFAYDLYSSDFTSEIIWLVVLIWPLKLSILSNHAEYLKKIALFVIRTTSFYNSKISIPNKSACPFREK